MQQCIKRQSNAMRTDHVIQYYNLYVQAIKLLLCAQVYCQDSEFTFSKAW